MFQTDTQCSCHPTRAQPLLHSAKPEGDHVPTAQAAALAPAASTCEVWGGGTRGRAGGSSQSYLPEECILCLCVDPHHPLRSLQKRRRGYKPQLHLLSKLRGPHFAPASGSAFRPADPQPEESAAGRFLAPACLSTSARASLDAWIAACTTFAAAAEVGAGVTGAGTFVKALATSLPVTLHSPPPQNVYEIAMYTIALTSSSKRGFFSDRDNRMPKTVPMPTPTPTAAEVDVGLCWLLGTPPA